MHKAPLPNTCIWFSFSPFKIRKGISWCSSENNIKYYVFVILALFSFSFCFLIFSLYFIFFLSLHLYVKKKRSSGSRRPSHGTRHNNLLIYKTVPRSSSHKCSPYLLLCCSFYSTTPSLLLFNHYFYPCRPQSSNPLRLSRTPPYFTKLLTISIVNVVITKTHKVSHLCRPPAVPQLMPLTLTDFHNQNSVS